MEFNSLSKTIMVFCAKPCAFAWKTHISSKSIDFSTNQVTHSTLKSQEWRKRIVLPNFVTEKHFAVELFFDFD